MTLRPVLLIFSLPALAVLLWLGTWQLQRLEWKEALISAIESRRDLPPLPLEEVRRAAANGEDVRFFPVRLEGRFRRDEQVRFVTSVVSDPNRRDVYMPLDTALGRAWVHVGVTGEAAPIPTPREGAVGYVRRAERASSFVPDNDPASGTFYWPELAALGDEPLALPNHYLALNPAFDSQTDRFDLANRRASPELSNRHFGYALTWFGMAVVLVVVVLIMHRRAEGQGAS